MLAYSRPLGGGFRFRTRNPLVLVVLFSFAAYWRTAMLLWKATALTVVLSVAVVRSGMTLAVRYRTRR